MLTRSGRHSDSDSMFLSDTVSSRPASDTTGPIIVSDNDTDPQLAGPSTLPPKKRLTRSQTKKRQHCLCQFEFGKDSDGEVRHLGLNCPRRY